MNRVAGKVALMTGGALGLGRASALLLAREGARVVVTDIKESEGKCAADEIVDAGGEAIFLRHDVASEGDWRRALETTLSRFGRLDVLVNNAGVALAADVEHTSLEQWRWVMSINLDGVFLGTKVAIEAMKKTGGGSIINLSSIAGIIGVPGVAAYCASKGAVRNFTKAVALHCAQAGIRVNSIHPGSGVRLARHDFERAMVVFRYPARLCVRCLFGAVYPDAAVAAGKGMGVEA